jgi:hypothetical protein
MKNQPAPICMVAAVLLLAATGLPAATYYTALDGNDSNPGSLTQPWRTIQKAVNTLVAGDAVIVRQGAYDERVTTARGGTTESNRIRFQAEGEVTMKGWVINHPFITIQGFRVARWSGPTISDAMIRFGESGDYAVVEMCTVRGDLQVTRADMMFRAESNVITSAAGGFIAAGFTNGQTLYVGAATNSLTISNANRGVHTITGVTDTAISVASSLTDQGPLPIYLSAAYVYGLLFHSRSEGAIIRSNTFSNLGYGSWFVDGRGHRLQNNIVEQCNGWDIVHYSGTNHVLEGNWFRDSPLLVYQVSPDLSENWPTRHENILFTNNFIENMVAVLSSQKYNATLSGPITYSRNVFIGTGRFAGVFANTTFEHNTFLRVASRAIPGLISVVRHPLYFATSTASNAVIRNNIFVNCGQVQFPWNESTMGWYELSGPTNSVVAEGNFVASGPPAYAAKVGWPEGNASLNGGAPGFVNVNDPLGPDGIPFTADDGLRLLPTSKLVGAGTGGRTIGAYPLPGGGQLPLSVQIVSGHQTRLTWPETVETWILQAAPFVTGSWTNVSSTPVLANGKFQVTIGTTNVAGFYRLVR